MRRSLLLFLLAVSQTVRAQELPGLIATFKMDNICELIDESAVSPIYGVLNDVSPAANRWNSSNTALNFNVNTSYITLGVVEKLKLTGDKSISFWVKPTVTGVDRTGSIFAFGNAILIGYLEQSSIPKLSVKFANTQYQVTNLKTQWQIVTVTFIKDYSSSKSSASVYIDGVLSTEDQQNKSTEDYTDVIALMGAASQSVLINGFRGSLDDMRFYNRALTASEISDVALPVVLESFTAKRINGIIDLRWKTSSEENFSYFNVQRSTDGFLFTNIEKVVAGQHNYVTGDVTAPHTDLWYRLEMVDKDGKKKLSQIIKVAGDIVLGAGIGIFPNPAAKMLYIKGISFSDVVNIIGPSGSLIKQKRSANGIDITALAPGLYYVVISDEHGNKKLVSKFIKRVD